MLDLLLKHGTVISMDGKRRVIEDGAVGVEGNRIAFVGSSKARFVIQAKKQ